MPGQRFQVGMICHSPYNPPRGRIPEGCEWICVKRHPEKEYPEEWQLRRVGIENNEPPGIDEFPPSELEGVSLSKDPPRTLDCVTVEQLEKSARSGLPVTHADMSARALEDKER